MSATAAAPKPLKIALLAALCAAALGAVYDLSLERALQQLSEQTQRTVGLFNATLESTINRYNYLPNVLAEDPQVIAALSTPSPATALALSRLFARHNRNAQTLNIYLMDPDGLTLASSNHDQPDSFVTKNFSFRPYFIEAMANKSGRYFALGTATGKRGYYFSSPVYAPSSPEVRGVVVVKASLQPLENAWRDTSPIVLLSDEHGVVFSSSETQWLFKSLQPLSEQSQQELLRSRQYGQREVTPIAGLKPKKHGHFKLFEREDASTPELLHLSQNISGSGWWLHALADTAQARYQALRDTGSGAILLALVMALGLYFRQRQNTWRVLQRAKASLETRVQERTAELRIANRQLRAEASEKERSNKALREAQESLIHTSRLASIGELSTAISHELNQPITAVTAYAENACAFLERGEPHKTRHNLQAIASLTQRMSEITTTLKNHARKSDDSLGEVAIESAIQHALAIVQPRINSLHIDTHIELASRAAITTNQTRLEQILVNFLVNACDAVSTSTERRIVISTAEDHECLHVHVCDSGDGIAEAHLDAVFEPYFTTKGESRGLGLGLSICQSLAKSLNATLHASNKPDGGACFCLSFNKAEP